MIDRRTFVNSALLVGSALILGACGEKKHNTIAPYGVTAREPTPENGYFGRWFDKEINGVTRKVSTTPGAYLVFDVTGTKSLEVIFEDMGLPSTPWWAYQVDGATPVRKRCDDSHLELPDDGQHNVAIIFDSTVESANRWEDELGIALSSIDSGPGGIAQGHTGRPIVAFYGDSITEGDCALGAGSSPEKNSATNGYAWLTKELLGCEAYIAGYGAAGITCAGSFTTASESITHLSASRTAPDFNAALVVVEYGSNDPDADRETFCAGYRELVEQIRAVHPTAPLCCMIPIDQVHAEDIVLVVEELQAKPEMGELCYLKTDSWSLTYTDGVHPDTRGAAKMASLLADELKARYSKLLS